MATPPLDKLNDAVAGEAFLPEAPPLCPRCRTTMLRSEVRAARRDASRAGAHPLPMVLPTWSCAQCGRRQPRVMS